MSDPKVSIIIRTFNEQKNFGNLLQAIQKQDYRDFEIVVVDSGSTDKTLEIARDFGCQNIVEIPRRDFTFGYSLNMGCKNARGQYLVFVSAHVVPQNNKWLGNLLSGFNDENVAAVYGRQLGAVGSKFSEKRDFERLFKESICLYPNNANSAVRKDLWEKYNFDEYLFGLEDMEWAKRLKDRGFKTFYEPKAAVFHIHNETWPQVFNRYRREAIAAARLGLLNPPQVKISVLWILAMILGDFAVSLPKILLWKEIIHFRYLQWKGTRQGWFNDRELDLNRDKYALFYPTVNEAVVIKGKYRAVLEETPLAEIKPGDILIAVNYVGVCRTDLEIYDGTLGYYKNGQAQYPIIPGHEFSGTIVQIGASTKYRERFKVGQRVVGECILSRDSQRRQEVGVINYQGAYARFIIMPGEYLHEIPEGLDLKAACLAEPLAVVLRALRRTKPRLNPKAEIAVAGAGAIGNFCAQALAKEGYGVTVFDKNQKRLDIIKNKVKAVSREIIGLDKFDLVVEATGVAGVLDKILRESGRDATLLLLGFPYGNLNYNFEGLVGQEKVVFTSVGGDEEAFNEALKLLPLLDTAPFLEEVMPLSKFNEAWEKHRQGEHLKIILKIKENGNI